MNQGIVTKVIPDIEHPTILDYFDHTATLYPNKIAVVEEERKITYQELRNQALRYGSKICEYIEHQKPVMILANKSGRTLAAMFGTIYAGGFYVNVNPEQPVERMRKIITSLEPMVVVVERKSLELLKASGYQQTVLILEDYDTYDVNEVRLQEIRKEIKVSDRLYGIYTSGSTGIPKGIVVSQKAVIQFIHHFIELFDFTENDVIGNQAPFDFDVSVKDIYSSILVGATLVLIPKEYFSVPTRLVDFLCDQEVTTLTWAVSALCLISAMKGLDYRIPSKVKKILFSGEVMPIKQLLCWQKALPDTEFVNLYGPSEITCNCTYYRIDRQFGKEEKIPIGKAFPGREVVLLDEKRQIINEPGIEGEICVIGESLAEGYYNNQAQTEKSFIEYRFPSGEIKRMYCTGDLGFYGQEEELYFSGRKDFQIKHMGHRIELEEIERVIMETDEVSRVCCVFDQKKNKLFAYFTGTITPEDVHSQLKRKIPLYMVPNKIIHVETMPLNKNGKIDRKFFAPEERSKL